MPSAPTRKWPECLTSLTCSAAITSAGACTTKAWKKASEKARLAVEAGRSQQAARLEQRAQECRLRLAANSTPPSKDTH